MNDMNPVLNTGNELYHFLTNSSTKHDDYVLISEIPRHLECFNKDYFFEFRVTALLDLLSPSATQGKKKSCAKPSFDRFKIFNEDLVRVENKKSQTSLE